MPTKNSTSRPQHVIDEAVKRYMAGEPVTTLSKYYKISRPGFYLWVKKYKEDLLEKSKTAGMSPKDAEQADKRVLLIELEQARQENRKLRDKVVALMLKGGEI